MNRVRVSKKKVKTEVKFGSYMYQTQELHIENTVK